MRRRPTQPAPCALGCPALTGYSPSPAAGTRNAAASPRSAAAWAHQAHWDRQATLREILGVRRREVLGREAKQQSRGGGGLGGVRSRGPGPKGETEQSSGGGKGAEVVSRSPGEGTNRTSPTGPARRPQGTQGKQTKTDKSGNHWERRKLRGGGCLLPSGFLRQTGQRGEFFVVGAGITREGQGRRGKGPRAGEGHCESPAGRPRRAGLPVHGVPRGWKRWGNAARGAGGTEEKNGIFSLGKHGLTAYAVPSLVGVWPARRVNTQHGPCAAGHGLRRQQRGDQGWVLKDE